MPLEYESYVPADVKPGATVIVLLHGRGSDRFDLLALRSGLPPGAIILTPQAPFPAAPWGYGPGWAWYRYLGENRPHPEDFDRSQALLREFLDSAPERLPVVPGRTAVGGFSQGGTMSIAAALREPGRVPLVLNFSGFLPSHPSVPVTPESVRGTRIFWGHGTDDQAIPFAMAEQGRRALRTVGADLVARDYRIGHWIDSAELADAAEWLESATDGTAVAPAQAETE